MLVLIILMELNIEHWIGDQIMVVMIMLKELNILSQATKCYTDENRWEYWQLDTYN